MANQFTSSLATMSIFRFLLLLFFISPSHSGVFPSSPVTPGTACKNTPYPYFCKCLFPPYESANLYYYTRSSLSQSLSNAYMFLDLVNQYLDQQSSLPETTLRALEDCQLLLGLNIDFLLASRKNLNSSNNLSDPKRQQVHTLLSALLTNHQTCLDGLQGVTPALSPSLSNGIKLYSVSLALFTHAWVPGLRKGELSQGNFVPDKIPRALSRGRNLLFHDMVIGRDGHLPLTMSNQNRKLFELRSGRQLLLQPSSSYQILVSDIVVVCKDGSGNFTTINGAVDSAPNRTNFDQGYYLIYIVGGMYKEYISVAYNKAYLMMIGDGINQTVITGDRSMGTGWGPFNSATLAIVGQGFVAINITIRNTAGPTNKQAVAVRNGADLSTFYSCSFEGYQDTLYAHSLTQFYKKCDIYGTVDFIFGNAAAVFQGCNLYPRLPIPGQDNVIVAQGRIDQNQNTGTSIQGCNIKAASDLASSGGSTRTYLGRPWKLYSRTVIMESFMDSLIDHSGWLKWNETFALDTLYYGEYKNWGPGSRTIYRVTWPGFHLLTSTDAIKYTVTNFIMGDDWLPQSGVPYSRGLV